MDKLTFAVRDDPTSGRVAEFREVVAEMCRLEIAPLKHTPFQSTSTLHLLPEMMIGVTMHSPCVARRTQAQAASEQDHVLIHIPVTGGFSMQQQGGALLECQPGELYFDPNELPGVAQFQPQRTDALYVSLPRALLTPVEPQINRLLRSKQHMNAEWRLFAGYVQMLGRELPHLSADASHLASRHLRDLVVAALSKDHPSVPRETAPDAAAGVRAARLAALKRDITQHLTNPALCVDWLAARHGISPRYVRALFADEQTCFSDHVLSQRLQEAHRLLTDPYHHARTISDIAWSVGFGDLSWFNQSFRRRFQKTPSEVRARV